MSEMKITPSLEKKTLSEETHNTNRMFWATIALAIIFDLVSIYIISNLIKEPRTTIIYLGLALFISVVIATWVSVAIAFLRRSFLSVRVLFFTINLLGLSVVTLFAERAVPASFSVFVISLLLVVWVFPKQFKWWYLGYAAATFALIWGIDALGFAWRLALAISPPGPGAAVVFGLFLLVFSGVQLRDFFNRSLRLRITLWSGLTIFVLSTILVAYSALSSRQTAIQTSEDDALQHASTGAGVVRTRLEIPLATARALAEALSAVKDPTTSGTLTREQVDAMLRHVLLENPGYLGTYTLWEPNQFDGLDAEYRNTANSDETGRFIPYWIRGDDGTISVVPLEQYETPGIGDWYILPRQNKVEMTFAPLIYPINGVDTVMASFVVPVIEENTFYGIAGVDAPISFVQELVDSVDLYNGTAKAVLLTATGTLIGVGQQPELVNEHATQIFSDYSTLQARLEAGEAFISLSPDGKYLRAFAPVDLGRTGQHWAYSLIVPFEELTVEATRNALIQAGISFVLIVLALFLLWFLTGRVVRPLLALTGVARDISEGNLDRRAVVSSQDEVGTLAATFNTMTAQLQEILQDLEQRVADRTRALETSSEVSRRLSTILDLNQLLKEVVDQIQQAFHYYHAHIYLFDETRSRLVMAGGTGEAGRKMLANQHALAAGRGLVGRAGETNQIVLVPLTTADPNWLPNPLLPETKAEVAVPIAVGSTVLGVLDVQHNVENGIRQADADLLQAIANQVAIALQNARSYTQVQQRAEQEAFMARVGQRIQSAVTVDEVLKVAVTELGQVMGTNRTVIQIGQGHFNGENGTQH